MKNLKGEFVIREGNQLFTYENTDDIPLEFDNMIRFNPTAIEGPHTVEEHAANAGILDIFRELMKRERKKNVTNF